MQARTHYLWIILPVLPVLLGFAVLNILNDGTIGLLADAVTDEGFYTDHLGLRFFNALIVFAAIGFFQVLGCLAVIVFVALRVARMTPDARRKSLVVFGASCILVLLISIGARQESFAGAINLAYRSTCAVLVKSEVAPHILPGGCNDPGLSHFAWLGLLPYLAGILAAAAASAIVGTAHQQQSLEDWSTLVEQAFRATAFVLVASTIAMMLFYHLPLSVVADPDTRDLISGFAQGMTLFWGIVFSLTLLAVFGPGQLLLSQALAAQTDVAQDLRERIAEQGTYRQAKRVLTTLSPLLVGSSAGILDMLTSAWVG